MMHDYAFLKKTTWGLLLFLLSYQLPLSYAQQKVAQRRSNKIKIIGDTTKVYYTHITNPTVSLLVDSSLYEFEEVEVTWNRGRWFNTLGGLLRTPTFDLVYQAQPKGGFRVGLDQFERYRLKREDIKYYQIRGQRPFTELYYSQINQQNNIVKADFGHKFSKQVYLGVHYDLSNQSGFYTYQRMRNQNVGITVRYFSPNNRYHGYFNFLTNANKEENNGGIKGEEVSGLGDDFLATVDVASKTILSRYIQTEVSYTHFLYNKGLDSTNTTASNEWSHRISYGSNNYKAYDTNPPTDSSIHGLANVNPRGSRLLIQHQTLENEIGFRQAIGGNLKTAPFWVKGYARHTWNSVAQDPLNFDVHNVSLGLIAENNPQYRLKYRAEGRMTWAERQLDFYVKGSLGYDAGKWGHLEGQALFQRYQPSLIDRQLYISQDLVWDNNLLYNQVQEVNFGGSYSLKRWGFRAEVLNHTLTNWIYYDSLRVRQAPSSINILQIKLQENLHIWKLHLDNQVIWQPTLVGQEYLRLPELLFKHNLYFQSYLFKKAMLAKIGVLFYYQTAYKADAYAPLTGAFYLQNQQDVAIDPRLDVYVSFRIWQFRCFIRAENLLYFVYERNYFTAYKHPITNFVVRAGFSWRLFD